MICRYSLLLQFRPQLSLLGGGDTANTSFTGTGLTDDIPDRFHLRGLILFYIMVYKSPILWHETEVGKL